ncbi:MAG: RNA 2',3'-cyclic phosphodiesterase [Verrucomicrobiota bacterium]
MRYNWQKPDWPDFRYELDGVTEFLLAFADHAARVGGLLEGLPDELGTEAVLDLMIAEAIQTSAIEGEILQRDAVRSSIRNRLGLNPVSEPVDSCMADGAGELMVAVRETFHEPLSAETLFAWHRMLLGGTASLLVGGWREDGDPMQIVSGRIDRPTVHFEAPPSRQVPGEMARFILWFNDTAPGGPRAIPQPPVRSALAHLYFESIHPFEDGNGRIGRALSEKALSQGMGSPAVLSLSRTIEALRNAYYDALKTAQQGNDVTAWVRWFVEAVLKAQQDAEAQIRFVLVKTKFFQRFENDLDERQLKVIRRMFEAGPEGFTGGMNAAKYIALTQTSKATATRDLQHLAQLGALVSVGYGRRTSYELNLSESITNHQLLTTMDTQLLLLPEEFRSRQINSLFVAILPDEASIKLISESRERLEREHETLGKLVRPQQFHMTLIYIDDFHGDIPERVIRNASDACQASAKTPSFPISLDQVESFRKGSENHTPVMTCGDNPMLMEFQKSLLKELILHGLPCKRNPKFNPHVTLSRGSKEIPKKLIEPISWMVADIVLVQSVIGQGRHIHLGWWQLALPG